VIVCEGYTDTIALHQARMRNAVGLMGTALTAEQVGELARMSKTVLLALDSDAAGQEAMMRAASVAARRRLELRVVALPEGRDPAELIAADGAEAMRSAVDSSVPFARFRVERVLAAGDRQSAEGKDRILDELRPVFASMGPSASRNELLRMVSNALDEGDSLIERELSRQGGGAAGRSAAAGRARSGGGESAEQAGRAALSRREETERAFLALCIASPEDGARALGELELEEHFSSGLLRRAASHLRAGSLSEPMASRAGEDLDVDQELKGLLAELVVEAGREEVRPGMLEVQRLQLELARIERDIRQARTREGTDVSALAARKGAVKRDFDRAYAQVLDETGERG
jgi:DNA primase